MSQVITTVYEHGVLHPVTPVRFHEHQRVNIQLVPETASEKIEHVLEFLTTMGLLTPPHQNMNEIPTSEEERRQLSVLLGKAASKPLSSIILEERGESISSTSLLAQVL